MDYGKKAANWCKKMKEEGSTDIERLILSDDCCLHETKDRTIQPDFIYFCLLKDGKRMTEHCWKQGISEQTIEKYQILIKDKKKMMFITDKDEAYGFGFSNIGEGRSIILYMRIGSGITLTYSDALSDTINVMYGWTAEKAERFDSLLRFVEKEVEGNNDEHKNKESECC